jgi:hypothetical protein
MARRINVSTPRQPDFDRITLTPDRKMRFLTGKARDIVAGMRAGTELSDTAIFNTMAGWSNGYVTFTLVE